MKSVIALLVSGNPLPVLMGRHEEKPTENNIA